MKISHAEPPKGSTTGMTPDFTIFTSAMEADPERENVVRMIGSSTERDLHGDTMAISALTDMAQVEPGMVIWLNHDYELPGSLFGSLLEKPELRLKDGIADLHIVSSVETTNPNAVQTYGYIRKGTRLGCSIGCMILECEIDEENDDGHSWWPPLIITHVLPLEWSVVGIPANQRSWVENAIKGLFERSLSSGKVDEALRLASAMKSLWPKDFPVSLRTVEDASLRKELEAIPARKSRKHIEWDPHQKTFMMNQKGLAVPLDRKDIPAFMAKSGDAPRIPVLAKQESEQAAKETEAVDLITAQEEETPIVDEVAGSTETITVPATNAETKEEAEIHAFKSDPGSLVFKDNKDTTLASVPLAENPTSPLDLQLFNALAARFGQPQITLDAQGQIQASKDFPEITPEVIQEAIAVALNFGETTKSGSTFSKKNQQTLQSLHNSIVDMCKSQFHPCEEMSEDSEDGGKEEDKQKGVLSAELVTNSEIPALREDFKALIETLKSQGHLIDAKAVKDLMARIEAADRRIELADKRLKDIQTTTKQTEENLANLRNAPLGQPTLLKRGIRDNGDTVTHQDFKALSAVSTMNDNERRWTLEKALEATLVVPRTLAGGETMNYRKWPEGVGGSVKDGVRPALTAMQKQWMVPAEWISYNDGDEAAVPCYDDPGNVEA